MEYLLLGGSILGGVILGLGLASDNPVKSIVGFSIAVTGIGLFGLWVGENSPHKTSEPITPTVEVKCINNICDTTYVYEFNK